MQKKVKASIIIVHYKNFKRLFECLTSIYKTKPKTSFEIIVVDNDPVEKIQDILKRKFEKVKYIKSLGNIGFGRAVNLGSDIAKGEYLFVLNPDTKLLPNSLDNLAVFLERNQNSGVVSPILFDKDFKPILPLGSGILTPVRGIFALSFLNKIFPNNKISKGYYLRDLDFGRMREVDCIPGSAFMIRKKLFSDVGGFDEKFFLYFEESDLCKRIKEKGMKLYIIPGAKVIHYGGQSTKNGKNIERIFAQSRYYYFQKNYGVFKAIIVEMFALFSKWHALFVFSLFLGIFLRFYRIGDIMVFHGEIGHNYLAIKNFIQNRQIPLVGPPTSHPWLSFSPLFYWIFVPLMIFANYDPLSGAYFFAVIGILVIIFNFIFINKLFGKEIAAISSFFLSFSPLWITLTRESRFFSLSTLFFYPFLFFLLRKKWFLLGIFWGLMLNFHYSPVILLPGVFIAIYISKDINFIVMGRLLGGLILANIPIILSSLLKRPEMLLNLLLWFPYRILGFVGLYPKNTVSFEAVKSNSDLLIDFIGKSLLPRDLISYSFLAFAILTLAVLGISKKSRGDKKIFITSVLFLTSVLAIFMHTDAPIHYYLPIYPLPLLFIAMVFQTFIKRRNYKIVSIVLLIIIFLTNLSYYFSEKWFYLPQDRINNGLVPFGTQKVIAKKIIDDASGEKFSLSRVGQYDYFEGNYAQNYRYLLWWMGNEPQENQPIKYIIYEGRTKDLEGKYIFGENGMFVTKKIYE